MEFFNPNSKVDFMGARKWAALLSILIFVISIGALWMNGLKWGLDFTGGTQVEVSYPQAVDLSVIRDSLYNIGFKEAQVVSYGTSKDVLISIAPRADLDQQLLVEKVMQALPGGVKQRVDFVGPQVGQELATKGILAIVVSLLATMIYIAMRFEYRLAFSSAVALVHDPVLILGVFALFGIEFDLKALAGLIMTSVLTLFVVVALFVYGGETIHGFALALIIGIVVGTYSSIYVAGALAVVMGLDRKDFWPTQRKEIDERP